VQVRVRERAGIGPAEASRGHRERGQGLIEYAIVLLLVALVACAGIYLMTPRAPGEVAAPDATPGAPTPTPIERIAPTPTPDAYRRARGWPFFDGFGTEADRWQEVAGARWRVEDGRYCAGPGGEHRSFAGDESWTDYTIHVEARLEQGPGYGVYFRATDWPRANAYVFQYDLGHEGGVFLFRKVVDGQGQEPFAVASVSEGFDWRGVERRIRIAVKGDTLTAYVDDHQVLQARDSTFAAGGVGLRTWGGSEACFDNVRVGPVDGTR